MKERIAKARELITSSNNTLSEIAEQCGFSSQSHLSRCINAEYGITPSKMRKIQ
jgi:AraC family transcriptional regulator